MGTLVLHHTVPILSGPKASVLFSLVWCTPTLCRRYNLQGGLCDDPLGARLDSFRPLDGESSSPLVARKLCLCRGVKRARAVEQSREGLKSTRVCPTIHRPVIPPVPPPPHAESSLCFVPTGLSSFALLPLSARVARSHLWSEHFFSTHPLGPLLSSTFFKRV